MELFRPPIFRARRQFLLKIEVQEEKKFSEAFTHTLKNFRFIVLKTSHRKETCIQSFKTVRVGKSEKEPNNCYFDRYQIKF